MSPRPQLRRALGAVALAALLLGATACSGGDDPGAAPTRAGASETPDEQVTGDLAIDPPTDGPVGVFGDLQALPDGFPSDLPLVAGELRVADPMDGGGFTVLLATGIADPATAADGAVELLTGAGWAPDAALTTAYLSVLTQDDRTVTVGHYDDDGQTVLNYLVRVPTGE